MKYTLIINQKGIVDSGLYGKDKTDLIDWVIIDYLHDWQTRGFDNAKKVIIGEKFFLWINYKYLIKELPMIGINTKKGISDRIKKLRELDLIETHQTKDNSLYVRITAKAINVNYDQKNSEQNPPVNPQVNTPVNPRVNTPVNPRVNSTNSNTNKQNTNKQREKETSPAAAQNGKPATQPTDENISLSPENFLRGFVEHWIASNGTHSNPLTDKEFIELAKALHPKRPDGTNVKNRIELEKITKQIPPADRIWLLIRIIKYSQDDIILDDSGKPTFAKFLDKYIEDFHPLIDQEKEHYRERLHETQREIERETAQREAREAEEREHREQVRIVAEFENRLESMTDDEWRTIAEKTLAYIRENDGIVAYNRAKSKIDVFDNFYTKWQGAKLFFEIDA